MEDGLQVTRDSPQELLPIPIIDLGVDHEIGILLRPHRSLRLLPHIPRHHPIQHLIHSPHPTKIGLIDPPIHTGGKGWCTDKVHCKYIASSGAKELIMYQTGTCSAHSKYTRQIQPPYPSLGYCQDIQDMPGHVTTMFQISNHQGYFEYPNTKQPKCAWVVCFECSLQYSRPCDHHVPNWDISSSFGMCQPSSTNIFLIALFKIYLQCFHNIPSLGNWKHMVSILWCTQKILLLDDACLKLEQQGRRTWFVHSIKGMSEGEWRGWVFLAKRISLVRNSAKGWEGERIS